MLEKQEEGKNSQFLEGCNTDWNLNHELICWLNYWFKEYLKNASGMVDLEYHRYKYKEQEYSQKEIIIKIIELTDKIHTYYYDFEKEEYKELENDVNEVFDLFKLVFWAMWW